MDSSVWTKQQSIGQYYLTHGFHDTGMEYAPTPARADSLQQIQDGFNMALSGFALFLGIYEVGSGSGETLMDGGNVSAEGTGNVESISSLLSQSGYDTAQITQVEEAFGPGAKVVKLTNDLNVYRYYGGGADARGRWVTTSVLNDPVNELALPPGSTAEKVAEWVIPKGTQVIEGTVASNFGRPGGAIQIFLPDSSVLQGR